MILNVPTANLSNHSLPFRKRVLPAVWGYIRAAAINSLPNCILHLHSGLRAVPGEMLGVLPNLTRGRLDIDPGDHMTFLKQYYPSWEDCFSHPFHKKFLELHVSWRLSDTQPDETYLDLAGGLHTYAGYLKSQKRLLNDRYVSPWLKSELARQGVGIVESFAQCM